MNFSDYHSLRKPLSLLLATALTTTMLAGCSLFKKAPDEPADTTPQTPGISLTDTSAPTETEAPTTEATEAINENTATVTSQLNIRSSPSTEATVVGTLDAGDKVEISRREEVTGISWAYIISPEAGWIVMDYVEMDIPSQMPSGGDTSTPASGNPATEPTDGETDTMNVKGVVTVNNLNIRSEGSSDGKVQGSYNKGDVVTILETKNGWGRTNKGWIKMEYVNTSGTSTQTPSGTTGNSNNNSSASTGNGSTTVQFRGIVTAKTLNIRASASKESESVGSYAYGARVEILEKSGDWGRTSKGWISLNYVYQDGTTGSNTAKGTITAGGGLNIRSGPGKGYASVGTYAEGDIVTVLEQFTYDGVTWGCTNKGWISMAYVDTGSGSSSTGGSTTTDGQQAIVTTESGLRVRSGAGTSYDVVGSLKYGTKVTILSQKTVDGTTWGEISTGWICMDYVSLN